MADPLEQNLRLALNAFPDPYFILGPALECCFANTALLELLGAPVDKGANVFWPTAGLHAKSSGEISTEFVAADKSRYRVKLQALDLGGGVFGYRILARQNSNESAQQYHQQRLETLGVLAGGVAHDFNNILAGVLGHVTFLKNILPTTGEHIESLSAIEEGGKKASTLTQQILNFSRLDPDERPSRIDLSDVVRRTCMLLRGAISPEFMIDRDIPNVSLIALGTEGKIAQVLINLCINARDALQPNGRIVIRLSTTDDRETLSRVFDGGDLSAPNFAVLCVEDDGCGMKPEIQKRIFEPYFSTKRELGTGLGLSTVRSIVREVGGAIDLRSEPGKGTTFSVYLPVIEIGTEAVPDRAAAAPSVEPGRERILVVDDEDPVRNILRMSLEHLGYKVDVASSGVEACERCSAAGQEYDLVILDMIMPGEGGDRVYDRLRAIYSDLKVLVISGYAPESAIRKIMDHGGRGFLQKPFTIEDLSQRVRSCLDDSKVGG